MKVCGGNNCQNLEISELICFRRIRLWYITVFFVSIGEETAAEEGGDGEGKEEEEKRDEEKEAEETKDTKDDNKYPLNVEGRVTYLPWYNNKKIAVPIREQIRHGKYLESSLYAYVFTYSQ